MQKLHVDIIMSLFCPNENHCGKKKKKKIVIVKNNIAIRIEGKVSRYIDASVNRATPSISPDYLIISCWPQRTVQKLVVGQHTYRVGGELIFPSSLV